MFRRQEETLNPDATYPVDLKKLGYFIDSSNHGCIRNIKAPDQFFDFFYTNNERHNEVRGESMRACQREEVLKRLSVLGIKQLYLPTLTNTKPDGPHIPILAPPAEVLKTRKRLIVLVNDDAHQDLGILAYRELQRSGGLNGGSIVNFVKDIVARNEVDIDVVEALAKDGAGVETDDRVPGLIVLNTAQLLYSHKFNKTLSSRSWTALPRKSISHDAIMVHPVENHVEGHRTPQEHIKSVFDSVVKNPDFVAPDAEVYVIAIENGAEKLLDVLSQDFWRYGGRITAMALIHSGVRNAQITDPALKAFLHMRTRQWKVADGNTVVCTQCTSLPTDYKPQRTSPPRDSPNPVEWLKPLEPREQNESSPEASARQLYANSTYYIEPSETAQPNEPRKMSVDSFILDMDPICPTFSGGDTWVGECIFTQRVVQQTIMEFFEEVARDAKNFCNPAFTLDIPAPTPDNPLTLSSPEAAAESSSFNVLPQEMLSPEQQTLASTKAILFEMKTALLATPSTAELDAGRKHLESRIAKMEAQLVDLEKQALATGGLGAGAAETLREKWENKTNGDKWVPSKTGEPISFAGVQADSEVVKGAGCLGTVEEELARLGMDGQ